MQVRPKYYLLFSYESICCYINWLLASLTGVASRLCPVCKTGFMHTIDYFQRSVLQQMCYMEQEYYRADYGYFKLPALPGWEKYVQKVSKTRENRQNQFIKKW